MHRRIQGVLILAAVVSGLAMNGCGSSTSGAHGTGTAVTTPSTSSISSPTTGNSPPETDTSSGTGTGTEPGTATGIGNTAGPCSGLDAQIVQLHGAASGTSFSDLVVVNRGQTTCTLPGQPKIEYLAPSHKTIPVRFSADPSLPSYRLAPGASAAMAIGYGTDGNQPCDDKIAYVRVTPPGTMVTVDGPRHCAHDGFSEEAWVAGSYAAPH